ncbi:hypothetical protein C1H46_045835 [Malus baccata]|uniref:Uncharacterized protein n=1 Tax=Malus baccata TaxID=106549 RepID=A0A540K436_MALBA|nr:hypothetical protein C1H46_045835 [Malus baccata]
MQYLFTRSNWQWKRCEQSMDENEKQLSLKYPGEKPNDAYLHANLDGDSP